MNVSYQDLLKEALHPQCQFCKREIRFSNRIFTPDIDYYGTILKGNGNFYHSLCANVMVEMLNREI